MTEFQLVAEHIMKATTPEELFGVVDEEQARKNWIQMQKIVHPDLVNMYAKNIATQASAKLNMLWEEAKERFANSIYGTDGIVKPAVPITLQTKRYTYTLTQIKQGKTCGIFSAVIQNRKGDVVHGVVKVPHSAADNDLLEREIVSLTKIKSSFFALADEERDNTQLLIPRILEAITHKDGRKIIAFVRPNGYEVGWYNLCEIKHAYPNGLTSRQLAFIGNRIFESLSFAHIADITHNSVIPNHIIIHAEKHLGQVIDWTCSGKSLAYIDSPEYLSPETKIMKSGNMTADVYSAAMCLLYLAPKGIGAGDTLVVDLEPPFVGFLNSCIQPHRRYRPQNAVVAATEFRRIQKQVFGDRQFVELKMT